ncbi:MAG: DUF4349 domain-containing protein [Actinomycetota bacterium]|nr:DUF4349 domain-containing protein [Actinomycetota bacterium]
MRHREPLDPEVVRELNAIDRALAGEAVDHDLHDLENLVRDVRASAPPMGPALTARLERELQQGFASPTPAGRAKRNLPGLRVLIPAIGTLAAALVALVLVIDPDNRTDDSPVNLVDENAAPIGEPASKGATSAGARSAQAPASAAGSGQASGDVAATRERKVERRVSLVLQTGRDKVESTADDVIRTVDRFRGIVASSSISADDQAGSEAVFDLRIATSKLDAALAALSKLGHVAERRQDLEDITAAFTSTRERLADARAERRGLLRALANAPTQAQIESLRSRLRLVRGQIASASTELSTLRRRASLSTVSVTVRGDGTAKDEGGGWSIGDAGGDALRALEVIAGIALIGIAVALPLALLGAVILFGSRLTRARRRENALDAA